MGSQIELKAVVINKNDLLDSRNIEVTGRMAQTLRALVSAGSAGIAIAKLPKWATRLDHYVFELRTKHKIDIETIEKKNLDDHPGRNWRYVLHSNVRLESYDPASNDNRCDGVDHFRSLGEISREVVGMLEVQPDNGFTTLRGDV
jgi:hypothetical protein